MNNLKIKRRPISVALIVFGLALTLVRSGLAQAFSPEQLYYFQEAAQAQDRSLIETSLRPDYQDCIMDGENCPDYDYYIVKVSEYWIHNYGRLNKAFMVLIVDESDQIFVETDLTSYFEEGGDFLVSLENGAIYDLRRAIEMGAGNLKLSQGFPSGSSGNDQQSPFSDDPSEGFLGSCSSMNDLKGCPYIPSESKNNEVSEPKKKVGPGSQSYPYGDAPGVDFHYHQQGRGGGSGTNPSGPDTFLDAITEIEEVLRGGVN